METSTSPSLGQVLLAMDRLEMAGCALSTCWPDATLPQSHRHAPHARHSTTPYALLPSSMPHTHAAAKSLRQNQKRRALNLAVLKDVRKKLHDARRAIRVGQLDAAKPLVTATTQALDRAVQKHVIAKNAAARTKSRLVKAFNGLKK